VGMRRLLLQLDNILNIFDLAEKSMFKSLEKAIFLSKEGLDPLNQAALQSICP